ncbi:hypothetical protein FKM82_028939 [Ascaphus truei]
MCHRSHTRTVSWCCDQADFVHEFRMHFWFITINGKFPHARVPLFAAACPLLSCERDVASCTCHIRLPPWAGCRICISVTYKLLCWQTGQ